MNSYIEALIRHLVAGVGVYLTTKGIADEATATAIVGGLVAVVSVGWSLLEKALRKKD